MSKFNFVKPTIREQKILDEEDQKLKAVQQNLRDALSKSTEERGKSLVPTAPLASVFSNNAPIQAVALSRPCPPQTGSVPVIPQTGHPAPPPAPIVPQTNHNIPTAAQLPPPAKGGRNYKKKKIDPKFIQDPEGYNEGYTSILGGKRHHGYVVTDYVLDSDFLISMWKPDAEGNKPKPFCDYLVFAFEICPTTKRGHFQTFIHYQNSQAWDSVRKNFCQDGRKRHVVPMSQYATPLDNRFYCLKGLHCVYDKINKQNSPDWGKDVVLYKWEDSSAAPPSMDPKTNAFEFGVVPAQGKRCDLDEIKEKIKSGEINSNLKLLEEIPFSQWCQYGDKMEKAIYMYAKPRDSNVETVVTFKVGPADSGKTRALHEAGFVQQSISGSIEMPFMLNYEGETKVFFDEIRWEQMTLPFFLKLTDRYPFVVNTKNGKKQFVATEIGFTANQDWRTFWPKITEHEKDALERRIRYTDLCCPDPDAPPMRRPIHRTFMYDSRTGKSRMIESHQVTAEESKRLNDELVEARKEADFAIRKAKILEEQIIRAQAYAATHANFTHAVPKTE